MNKNTLCITVVITFILCSPVISQEIKLHFPYFSGKEYCFVLIKGDKYDTVSTGYIPSNGQLTLNLPDRMSGYVGMARWMLKSGGGLDLVLNQENFYVECLSDTPNEDNIVFVGSAENDFLIQNNREQTHLQAQYEVINSGLKAYPPDAPLYKIFQTERARLQNTYLDFQKKLAESPLYAARFREIVNFTKGIGRQLDVTEAELAPDFDDFISRRMSWETLFTSNHWSGVIHSWVQMHVHFIRSDSVLLESTKKILTRLKNPTLYTAFCEKMVLFFAKYGKDNLLSELTPEIRESGRLLHRGGLLAQFDGVGAGDKAPFIIVANHSEASTAGPGLQKIPVENSVLIFYQDGCGACEYTMSQLVSYYLLIIPHAARFCA